MFESIFIGMMWLILIIALLILPLIVLVLVGQKRQHRKKAIWISLALLCAEVLLTVILCMHPLMINLSGNALTDESEIIIRYVSDGRYNSTLPVFPTAVVVMENEDGFLRWQTYYGIWGRTEHIYSDTYEMTEPLWRLSFARENAAVST